MGTLRGTKRGQAVAAAERGATGALPLLGAPLLAVIATFVLQPKTSGSYPEGAYYDDGTGAESPALVAGGDIEAPSEWAHVQQALEARHFDVARSLLGDSPHAEARSHWQAYTMMVDCLERPSDEATTAAQRFYLEGAPADVRPELFRACLSAP